MRRTLPLCALLVALPSAGRGADAPDPTTVLVRLSVRPMAAPRPALKYQLLPELREMNPGNPVQAYSLCYAEQYNFWRTKDSFERRQKWLDMPLRDLPRDEMKHAGYGRGAPLSYADYAARLDAPDWQILVRLKRDGYNLMLPDIQQLRELASALKVRFRLEIAEGRFDDAVATAKTMFALARHVGENPTVIGELVAVAIATITVGCLEEMVQQPGAPNLYWALTDLPSPFIDLHKGVQAERVSFDKEAALLDDRQPMTEAQLRKVMEHYAALARSNGPADRQAEKKAAEWLRRRVGDADYLKAARKRLVESGSPAEAVEKFPPTQVVLLDQRREVEIKRDERTRALRLPYWQARRFLDAAPPADDAEAMVLDWMLIPFQKVKNAQTRLDQRIALLRCAEAVRLYAAGHEGRLPDRLDDAGVPLPIDPATGKPFTYKRDGGTDHLSGGRLMHGTRYELTITK